MLRQRFFRFVIVFVAILAIASVAFALVEGLTINPTASISPGRTMLTVSGTVTCPVGEAVNYMRVTVYRQKGNRTTIDFADTFPATHCTGSPMAWQSTVITTNGLWQNGHISVLVDLHVCTLIEVEPGVLFCDSFATIDHRIIDARVRAN